MNKYLELIEKTYNVLNGKINPIAPSWRLSFNHLGDNNEFANEYYGAITVNIDRLYAEYGGKPLSDVGISIIFMVAHELSHVDQNYSRKAYSTNPYYKNCIEQSNNVNVLKYLSSNKELLYNNICNYLDYDMFYLDKEYELKYKMYYKKFIDLHSWYDTLVYDRFLKNISTYSGNPYKYISIIDDSNSAVERIRPLKYNDRYIMQGYDELESLVYDKMEDNFVDQNNEFLYIRLSK